jgi:hypothetical protein
MIKKIINFLNRKKMENSKIFNQYSWVSKVLDSCENESQIMNTERLFQNFLNNCGSNITKNTKKLFITEFTKDVKKKKFGISKTINSKKYLI